MSIHYFRKQKTPITSTLPWTEFGHAEVLSHWARELKDICQMDHRTEKTWRIVGRGAVIVHPDKEQHLDIVRKVAFEAGMNLLELPEVDFMEWVVDLNLVPKESCPLLLYVPYGNWSEKAPHNEETPESIKEFYKALPGYLAALDPELPLVVVTTAGRYSTLAPELRTTGVFDRHFNVAPLSTEELGNRFLEWVGHDVCGPSLTDEPDKVGHLLHQAFSDRRQQSLIALAMQRRAARDSCLVGFDDLVHLSVFGSTESHHLHEADIQKRRRIAIHEAGHAVVSIIDSEGLNVPDYVGIVGSDGFKGVVTDSFAFNKSHAGHETYKLARHRIRCELAGRVAEAIILGPENVGIFSARSDLVSATERAKTLVGKCGFAPSYGNDAPHLLNLAVYAFDPTPSEARVIEEKAQEFLLTQYLFVENLLREHELLLNTICEHLMQNYHLSQRQLLEIWKDTTIVGLA